MKHKKSTIGDIVVKDDVQNSVVEIITLILYRMYIESVTDDGRHINDAA